MTAQSRREDAVGFRAALLWGIFVESSACFSLEGLSIQLESFAEGFVALFQHSSWASALCLGESIFLEEGFCGGFSEVVHLLHGFWVLSEAVSTGSLPIFSSFQ